jgi:glycosyltransferase involved in cell wall biosynthesis
MTVEVVRLVEHGALRSSTDVVAMEIDPDSAVSVRAAARLLNRQDVVMLQHEYGIYGRDDGEQILELLSLIDRPAMAVLHTVLPSPTDRQKAIVTAMDEQARLVALCESARDTLEDVYGVDREGVTVIHHGSHWDAQDPNDPPRRRLITWGLLGPGKGLERAIAAVAELRGLGTETDYLIVGRTHPEVARRQGFTYRHRLEELVTELGVDDLVRFVDRYVDDAELFELARSADVVVVPYDNSDQVSSGVITEAVSLARPVVATRFPYATEMLRGGAGAVVDHEPEVMAGAIKELLEDDDRYLQAVSTCASMSAGLSWEAAARRYAELVEGLTARRATA